MPDPYPMPSAGGPQYAVFTPLEPDGSKQTVVIEYADGGMEWNFIGNADGIRRWRIIYDGLLPAEATVLDAHFASVLQHTGFTLTTPDRDSEPAETILNVHYAEYRRPSHVKVWNQRREVLLEKRPS